MFIDDDIRKLLLDPMLNGSLMLPVDNFVLHAAEGPVSLAATLTIEPGGELFRIEVRDSEGRDLRSFFRAGNKVSVEDTLNASGVLGNRLRIDFNRIWPPSSSTTRPIGDVKASSAILKPEEIALPPSTFDSRTHEETKELLRKLNPHRSPPSDDETGKAPRYEHVAILANTKLRFSNKGTQWKEEHPFWGERSGSKFDSWDGTALDGEYSIRQSGLHLEIGFRHDGDDDDEADRRFLALLQTVAYTHAIFPWPTFVQGRRDGRVMKRRLKPVHQIQGKIIPLRESDHYSSPNSPTHLIAAVAGLFHNLPAKEKGKLNDAMWVFRGADSEAAPSPLQMAMICSVIEGFRSELFQAQAPPAAFKEVRDEALEWINGIEAASTCPERTGMIKRLKSRTKDWNYNDRRVEWEDAFLPLFPDRKAWVMEVFKLFNKHRHGPAHGSYGSITNGDPHEVLDAIGRLAGFVNIVIAARAGYQGPILESPFADRRIQLGQA